ncbi:MAG: poly(3-hydroxyalkanoate) depolymerase [Pseudomonadota bacterium]
MSSHEPQYHTIKADTNMLRVAVWKGSGKGNHLPILFFNGIGANVELIAPLPEALNDRDIIAFDAPGIGGSEPAFMPYRPRQFVRMAMIILDKLGYGDVDVMGVSWGGVMAQQFAYQYPDRTRHLILCATAAGVVMVPGNPKALIKMAHPRRYMDPDYMLKNFRTLYGDETGGAGDHSSRLRAPTMRGYFYQLLAGIGWTSVAFLPFLKVPVLVMAGDNDQIVPLINGRFLAQLIPNSRLEIVKGGHLFLVSRVQEVIPLIREFLDTDTSVRAAS